MGIVEFICLLCALKDDKSKDIVFPVDTDKSALQCPKCGSSTVLPKDKFLSVMQSTLNKPAYAEKMPRARTLSQTASLLDDQTRWDAPRVTDKGEGISIRNFLKRNKLHHIEDWWDGFRSFVTWSFTDSVLDEELPSETQSEWLELRLTCRSGEYRVLTFYFNPEDEGMIDIGDIKKK